jgi:glycosidase
MAKLNLQAGAFGDEVKNLHRKLIKHGLAIPSSEVDRAFFGPATRDAILEWQRTHGLPVTGIVDEQTNAALETAPQPASVQPQSFGPAAPSQTAILGTAPTEIFAQEIAQQFADMREAAGKEATKEVRVNGNVVSVPYPFPSPTDWRDCWMYFLILDRFANERFPPNGVWNQRYEYRQGGTFNGVTAHLDYLRDLGVKALWLSPVLKNSRPDWQYTYPGYDTQDFLHIDERFGSDGTRATAEEEFRQLVDQAHARDIRVIVDTVINHAGRVFDYIYRGGIVDQFIDPKVMDAPLGEEPSIQWLSGYGFPRADWQDQIPPDATLSSDDAVYPVDLQQKLFFRRRGAIVSYERSGSPQDFVKGDFFKRRQLVVEYDARPSSQAGIQTRYGSRPVLNILIRAYQYLIAKFDLDGFRIDTTKHVEPDMVEIFGNAIREFAHTLGKRNFFTFGEIIAGEKEINRFVGRQSTGTEGFGVDAALDYPLFFKLTDIIKGWRDVSELSTVFDDRKKAEEGLISSHGEAGKYFVTFLDNHDRFQRFNHPLTPQQQITMGVATLFCLQGIPAIYYGTEQGLTGTVDSQGDPDLVNNESVREALWGKPNAFDSGHFLYQQLKALSRVRDEQPALRFGRLYFRQVSGNGRDFDYSSGAGGLVAFSRVVSDLEVLLIANTHTSQRFDGLVLQDPDLNRHPRKMHVTYSNLGTAGSAIVRRIPDARFFSGGRLTGSADAAALPVGLLPMEVQVWVPEQPFSF